MDLVEIKNRIIDKLYELFIDADVDTDILQYVDLVDDLGMDSINFITIVVELERMFCITIPDDMLLMDNFKNVGDIVRIVDNEMKHSTNGNK